MSEIERILRTGTTVGASRPTPVARDKSGYRLLLPKRYATERPCACGCGKSLSTYNPGPLAYPCEARRREVSAETGEPK